MQLTTARTIDLLLSRSSTLNNDWVIHLDCIRCFIVARVSSLVPDVARFR
jgi:hypothetical protein